MSGEALMTASSATRQLAVKVLEIHQERVLAQPDQGLQELRAIQAGDLGRLLLGDTALLVPLDRSGQPQLAVHIRRCAVQHGIDRVWRFDTDRNPIVTHKSAGSTGQPDAHWLGGRGDFDPFAWGETLMRQHR